MIAIVARRANEKNVRTVRMDPAPAARTTMLLELNGWFDHLDRESVRVHFDETSVRERRVERGVADRVVDDDRVFPLPEILAQDDCKFLVVGPVECANDRS